MFTPLIICPLEIERAAAARIARGRGEVVRCGPGPGAVRALLAARGGAIVRDGRAVILFGVAGAMRPAARCVPIVRVIDARGQSWTPTLEFGDGVAGVELLGLDEPLFTLESKREWGERTSATLVDTESHALAEWAASHGVAWSVIRGVSDGPEETLPSTASRWVDVSGRARVGRVVLDLFAQPHLLGDVRRLARGSRAALDAAGESLDRALRALRKHA